MHIKIRELKVADIPLIQSIGRAAYEPYYAYLWKSGGLDWYMEHCFNDKRLNKEFADTNISYYLAETNFNEAIGFMKIYWQQSVPTMAGSKASLIEKIYLLPEYLGKRKGRFLINWVALKSKAKGKD